MCRDMPALWLCAGKRTKNDATVLRNEPLDCQNRLNPMHELKYILVSNHIHEPIETKLKRKLSPPHTSCSLRQTPVGKILSTIWKYTSALSGAKRPHVNFDALSNTSCVSPSSRSTSSLNLPRRLSRAIMSSSPKWLLCSNSASSS